MRVHGQTVDTNGGAEITNGGTGDSHGGTEDANGRTEDTNGGTGDANGGTGDANGRTEDAHGGTEDAHGGTGDANGGTGDAHGGTEDANGETGDANGETGDTNGETEDANGETEDANGETGDANGGTGDANGGTGDANGGTGDANGETEDANGGTEEANGQTGDANGQTGDANGETGDANGETGDANAGSEEGVKIYSCRAEALFDKRRAVNQPNTHLLGRMTNGIIRLDEGWHLDAGWHLDQLIPNPQPAPLWVLPNQKKGTKHMDFIPRKRGDQYLWWRKIRDSIEEEGPKFGLTVAQIAATKALAEGVVASMEATNNAQAALDGARTAEKTTISTNEKALRMNIRIWKATPGFVGSTSEGVLQVVGPESNFDPLTFKPTMKLSIVGGQVRVDFTKEECDSVAVYCRPRGTAEWTKLGNDTRSPYYDTKPLANPNVPEVREYMAIGVIDDVEIGVPSDIVQITLS